MKKIILLLPIILIVFSCKKVGQEKKKLPVVAELKSDNINISSENKQIVNVTIDLPNNHYAVVVLDSVIIKNKGQEPDVLYKPKKVTIFDRNTNNEIPEVPLDGIYYSKNTRIWYGDFNFDGKMDIVCQGKNSGYRDFYNYDIYLATQNGYELNKRFSKITDDAFETIELDSKNKKITVQREAEWDETWIYQVKQDKIKLIFHNKETREVIDN